MGSRTVAPALGETFMRFHLGVAIAAAAFSSPAQAETFPDRAPDGKMWMSRVTMRPQVEFSGDKRPSEADIADLHHRAHDQCFIANSVTTKVTVES